VTTSTVTSDGPTVKLMVDGARMSTYLLCGATQKKLKEREWRRSERVSEDECGEWKRASDMSGRELVWIHEESESEGR